MDREQEHSRLHIGMRNIKTALSVLVILAIYGLLGRDNVLLATTAAIICMQDSVKGSVSSGINRMIGTAFGALIGMLLLYLQQALGRYELTLLIASAGIVLTIFVCNLIGKPETVVISCIMVLIIVLEQSGEVPYIYSLNRLVDTLIGIAVAVAINRFLLNPEAAENRKQKGENPAMHKDSPDTIGYVTNYDPEVGQAIQKELDRQRRNLELIASENIVTPAVLAAAGSILNNKYAEGYPGKRYYGGCECVDVVENIAIERAKKIFGAGFANVQPHSGAQANEAAYAALVKPGDTVLGMSLAQGGHLTHGSPVNFSGKLYNIVAYGVDDVTHQIDYDLVRKIALEHKPKMIVAGASAYPRIIDFQAFGEIAREVGAYLMVDMAHIAGLVAAGVHPSPIPHADVVTTTTHKTLRGIRGGLILCNDPEIAKKIDKAVFPGTQGGPLMHTIAAKAVGFGEVLRSDFKAYQQQVVANCKALAQALIEKGFTLVSGGTDNHLILVDLTNMGVTGKEFEKRLDEVYITVNKNSIPNETLSPFVTSGIRIGTPAVTTRGLNCEDMVIIADCIHKAATDFEGTADEVRDTVNKLCQRYPLYQ